MTVILTLCKTIVIYYLLFWWPYWNDEHAIDSHYSWRWLLQWALFLWWPTDWYSIYSIVGDGGYSIQWAKPWYGVVKYNTSSIDIGDDTYYLLLMIIVCNIDYYYCVCGLLLWRRHCVFIQCCGDLPMIVVIYSNSTYSIVITIVPLFGGLVITFAVTDSGKILIVTEAFSYWHYWLCCQWLMTFSDLIVVTWLSIQPNLITTIQWSLEKRTILEILFGYSIQWLLLSGRPSMMVVLMKYWRDIVCDQFFEEVMIVKRWYYFGQWRNDCYLLTIIQSWR